MVNSIIIENDQQYESVEFTPARLEDLSKEEILARIKAVSYTHLDVYKRQVRDDSGDFTYRELDRMSDYIAQKLTENGFGPEQAAGILCGRTKEYTVAYVGVMKAGGAYVLSLIHI